MIAEETDKCLMPSRETSLHTPCYCEENVWKLCEWLSEHNPDKLNCFYAVFISNHDEKIPIWMQQTGNELTDGLIVWDYHVILVYDGGASESSLVFDLDTQLPFPCDLSIYLEKAIRDDNGLKSEFHRKFRVISAPQFLKNFSSDRSRMKRPDGSWIQEPPSYPPIQSKECSNNLNDFISMDQSRCSVGIVMSLEQFIQKFSKKSTSLDY